MMAPKDNMYSLPDSSGTFSHLAFDSFSKHDLRRTFALCKCQRLHIQESQNFMKGLGKKGFLG